MKLYQYLNANKITMKALSRKMRIRVDEAQSLLLQYATEQCVPGEQIIVCVVRINGAKVTVKLARQSDYLEGKLYFD
jgi:hypothetical protein